MTALAAFKKFKPIGIELENTGGLPENWHN
jgi:hypothetical protein